MKKKSTYRIRNWSQYNSALKQCGSLTVWVSSEAAAKWTTDEVTGEPGASPTYTDLAIETMATVQAIYGLAGRQTQGFLQSVFELMKLDLTAPDFEAAIGRCGARWTRRLRVMWRKIGNRRLFFYDEFQFRDEVHH